MGDQGGEPPEGEEEEEDKGIEVPENLNLLAFWELCKTMGEKGSDLSDCTVKLAGAGEGEEAPAADAPAEGEEDPDAPPPEPSEFKCHKLALCSASGYFFEQFVGGKAEGDDVELPKLPEDNEVKAEVPVGKIFPVILRYIYSNQDRSVITDEELEANSVGIWALATLLDIKSLIQCTRDYIQDTVLDPSTAPRILYIAVQFGDDGKSLQEACIDRMKSEFSTTLDASYEAELKTKESGEPPTQPSGLDLLCKLPVDTLVDMLGSDELNVRSEYEVFRVIRHLLHERLDREESTLTLSEIKLTDLSSDRFPAKSPQTAVWELIVAEGPARPELGGQEAHSAVTKKYSVKTAPIRIEVAEDSSFDLSAGAAAAATAAAGEGEAPENPDQLRLTFPTKGLTSRSGSVIFQAVIETEVSGSVQRELLAEALVPPQAWLGGEVEGAAAGEEGEEGESSGFKFELLCAGRPVGTVTCGKEVAPKEAPAEEDGGGGGGGEDEGDEPQVLTGGPLTADETKKILQCLRFPELRHEELVEANEDPWLSEADAQPYIIEAFSSRLSKIEPIYKGRPGEDMPKGPRPSTVGRSGAKAGGGRMRQPPAPKATPNGRELALVQSPTHQRPAPATSSQLALPGQFEGDASPARPIYFDHISDFDENGALYYLGTRGLSRVWANPCGLPQPVRVLTSGIGFGAREDLVGRTVVNLRTQNEPGSYFGIDLGGSGAGSERLMRIRGYCLRSRNATSHAPISWDFQGSEDGNNWVTLDKRRRETAMTAKSTTAYFQVQPPAPPLPGRGLPPGRGGEEPAYRCFRIQQPAGEKNSSGSDNLVLSGMELYGEAIQGTWS